MAFLARFLSRLVRVFCALAALGALLLCVCVFFRFPVSYDYEALTKKTQPTVLLDGEGRIIPTGSLSAYSASLDDVPDEILNVFVAAEDQRFYGHGGVDLIRIAGAAVSNLHSGGRGQGGSTITQQLIKNKLLTPEKSYLRKALEALFALQVEQDLSKREILLLYLDSAYFGKGATGLSQAAWAYFGKKASELTLVEAVSLAACLKAPSTYAPHISEERNRERREYILSSMVEEGFLSEQAADAAREEAPQLRPASFLQKAGWYADAALREAAQLLDMERDELREAGYTVETWLDADIQASMDELYAEPSYFPADVDGEPCQSAAVVMETDSSHVLALVGGREYGLEGGFERATQMRRQPGSAIKPLAVYAPALSRRFVTAASQILDAPASFSGYSPHNFGGSYRGRVSLRTALALSLNVPAVKLLDAMGARAGYDAARRFGLDPDESDANLSLGVGSMKQGVRPVDLCAAYAALGNGGVRTEPTLVRRILDAEGSVLLEREPEQTQATDAQTAYVVTNLLESAASWGTAKRLATLSIPVAAKTGTVGMEGSSGNRDAWCAAYTPEFSVCCWMGFDRTDERHCLPASVTGGGLPTALTEAIFARLPNSGQDFAQPPGVVWANSASFWEEPHYELYIEGTEPHPNAWSSWGLPAAPTPEPTPKPTPEPAPGPTPEPPGPPLPEDEGEAPTETPAPTPAPSETLPTPGDD